VALKITIGQSNLTQGRIAAADGRFNRILQLAPMCPPTRAHWRHLTNTLELVMFFSARLSPQPNRRMDRFSRFAQITAECPYTLQWDARVRIRDPNRHQNLIVYSLTHCQPSDKISCKSVRKFLAQSC